MIDFSREDLELIYKANLLRLAAYYGVEVKKYWKKSKIIDVLMEQMKSPEDEEPPMSVRIRRIYELNKEN